MKKMFIVFTIVLGLFFSACATKSRTRQGKIKNHDRIPCPLKDC